LRQPQVRNNEIEINKFLITLLHKVTQSLYKYVRFLISEHDKIETVLREEQSNEGNLFFLY